LFFKPEKTRAADNENWEKVEKRGSDAFHLKAKAKKGLIFAGGPMRGYRTSGLVINTAKVDIYWTGHGNRGDIGLERV
jgi:hypothetical protein